MHGILRPGLMELTGEVFDEPYSTISGGDPYALMAEIEESVREAEMMGFLDDPEIMGSWLSDLAKKTGQKIKKLVPKVQAMIAKVKQGKADAQSLMAPPPSSLPSNIDTAPKSIMDNLKNPLVLGGIGVAALIIVLVIVKKKKRGKK
jgi:hypothetical protein